MGFNLACAVHVGMVMADDMELDPDTDMALNIFLFIVTVVWGIAVGGAIFQYMATKEKTALERSILIYEVTTLGITVLDIFLRGSVDLMTTTTFLAPLSHGLISLRIVYIMFNNGFCAVTSYYF